MNSRNNDATDKIDHQLRRCLKNWVSGKHPSQDARGRLLEAASRQATQQIEKPTFFSILSHQEFQEDLFSAFSRSCGYTLQNGVLIR